MLPCLPPRPHPTTTLACPPAARLLRGETCFAFFDWYVIIKVIMYICFVENRFMIVK
jgi:hypothetical protein